jgi:hypothetical protein
LSIQKYPARDAAPTRVRRFTASLDKKREWLNRSRTAIALADLLSSWLQIIGEPN